MFAAVSDPCGLILLLHSLALLPCRHVFESLLGSATKWPHYRVAK